MATTDTADHLTRKEMTESWTVEIRGAETCLELGDRVQAKLHARLAAALAEKLRDPKHLRKTAAVWLSLSNPKAASRMRLLASRCARADDINAAGSVECAAFLSSIGIEPRQARSTVFQELKYERGRSWLASTGKKFFLACTSRTGSTLLAASLERYGLRIEEYFNPERIRLCVKAGHVRTLLEYADFIETESFAGGWFGSKGAVQSLLFLCYLRELPELVANWKFVFLTRRNLVRQAVSMEIAERTGRWRSDEQAQAVVKEEHYRFEALLRRYQYILDANNKWERVFAFLDIQPLRLTFEEVAANIVDETKRVAGFLGIELGAFPNANAFVPWPQAVSTALNGQWERRFRRDLAVMMRERQKPKI